MTTSNSVYHWRVSCYFSVRAFFLVGHTIIRQSITWFLPHATVPLDGIWPFPTEDIWPTLTPSHQIFSEKDANFCAEKTWQATFSSEWKLMAGDFRRTWKCAGECRYLDIFSRKWSLNLEFVVKNAWGKKDVKWKPAEWRCCVLWLGGYCWNSQVEQLEFNSAVIH